MKPARSRVFSVLANGRRHMQQTLTPQHLGFWARVWLAFFILPWKTLLNAAFAARVQQILPTALATPEIGQPSPTLELQPEPAGFDPTPALQLLAIMQREGRLIDFLEEDVSGFSDAQVGAAARVVHDGCKRGLDDYVVMEPVLHESEGASITLEPGFDAARTRVTGNVVGEPPFRGRLAHHGWWVKEIKLPQRTGGQDPSVVAQAEVEL